MSGNTPGAVAKDDRPFVSIQNVSKRFDQVEAVKNLSLDIRRGELFCLLGGSGSGKSTLLRMLAGFEVPSDGKILLDGQDMTGVPPHARPTNMMFQSYALFPHMSVARNIAYGLQRDGLPKAEITAKVEAMLELVKLKGLGNRKPHQLSGGQRQRVALARSLVKKPKLLLLDEPLGALDKKLRAETQFELIRIQEELGITFIVVTHDQEEAMTLAWRIGVMRDGELIQVGSPKQVYQEPNSRYVADFIGLVNLLEQPDGTAHAIRPERMVISRKAVHQNHLEGVLEDIGYLGSYSQFRVRLADRRLIKVQAVENPEGLTWEDKVVVSWPDSAVRVLTE